ncbi:hypothetical protein GJ744_010006 [Endocarpon pusillum]|uniref:Uncharacterized protein n=1 Tax=Endocarpon pusillum TaxID=364733 RepID=A0A8H7AH99_9EURO|nr:hypothetical protein GJ744_010006 [Endocarpon pusillum]
MTHNKKTPQYRQMNEEFRSTKRSYESSPFIPIRPDQWNLDESCEGFQRDGEDGAKDEKHNRYIELRWDKDILGSKEKEQEGW